MRKTEVIVDTCFLQKLSSEGKAIDNIKRVLTELEYVPVAHPYIYEYELSLHSYFVQKAMRERDAVSGIKAVWRENHTV